MYCCRRQHLGDLAHAAWHPLLSMLRPWPGMQRICRHSNAQYVYLRQPEQD